MEFCKRKNPHTHEPLRTELVCGQHTPSLGIDETNKKSVSLHLNTEHPVHTRCTIPIKMQYINHTHFPQFEKKKHASYQGIPLRLRARVDHQ